MDSSRTIRLIWSHGALADVTYRLQFSHFSSHTWQPAINAYRCKSCVRICVDLAGVEKADIELTVAEQRLSLRGVRDVPEPAHEHGHAMQMIAMEIDYGPFQREIPLPDAVDIEKVHAEQENGLLWIHLPLKKA